MSETPEKNLQLLNDGRMTAMAAQHFGGLLSALKSKKMAELTQHYRSGKIDHPTMLAGVAGICALEDLEQDIKRRILKGEHAGHDLHKGQT